MISVTSHERTGPVFEAAGYLITPVCAVFVTSYAERSGGGVIGSVEPVALLVVRGNEQWRIPVPRQPATPDPPS